MPAKILVVDDEKQIRSLLHIFLKKKGFDVMEAQNAGEALKAVTADKGIDLVLLDNRMPGTQGSDIIDDLRLLSPAMKIVLITGSISSSQKDLKLDMYLRKPVDLNKLLDIVNQLLAPTS